MGKTKSIDCRKNYQFISIPVCSVCSEMYRCDGYYRYYKENKDKVINEIIKYVNEHKDKYEIGVLLMPKATPEKKYLVFESGKIIAHVTKSEVEKMVTKNPNKYKNSLFLPVTQVMVPVVTIKLITKKMTDTLLNKMVASGK